MKQNGFVLVDVLIGMLILLIITGSGTALYVQAIRNRLRADEITVGTMIVQSRLAKIKQAKAFRDFEEQIDSNSRRYTVKGTFRDHVVAGQSVILCSITVISPTEIPLVISEIIGGTP